MHFLWSLLDYWSIKRLWNRPLMSSGHGLKRPIEALQKLEQILICSTLICYLTGIVRNNPRAITTPAIKVWTETNFNFIHILILITFTFSDWSEIHVIKLISTINFWQEDVHHWLTCGTKIIKYSNSWVKESISMDIYNTLIRNPPWWSNGNQYLINDKKGR